jgi:hypothetical protein
MATKEELAIAAKVIKEVAGDPTVGAVKDLIDVIETFVSPAKEVRVTEVKETR